MQLCASEWGLFLHHLISCLGPYSLITEFFSSSHALQHSPIFLHMRQKKAGFAVPQPGSFPGCVLLEAGDFQPDPATVVSNTSGLGMFASTLSKQNNSDKCNPKFLSPLLRHIEGERDCYRNSWGKEAKTLTSVHLVYPDPHKWRLCSSLQTVEL